MPAACLLCASPASTRLGSSVKRVSAAAADAPCAVGRLAGCTQPEGTVLRSYGVQGSSQQQAN